MTDDPDWFAPKRYGYGSGMPISWQGWVATIAFLALVTVLSYFFADDKPKLIAALAPVVIAFVVICARTTRGGWRWRWGEKD